ncbi:glycosyltransferase family 4 protein [Undibacterium flavidum]|uniref:Glycosyltransferase family 4 protein n=1 Tax=Undibacterium flavidum TaxID=2762297 RepID=A0ABR6YAF2_9BURK|nr:glycosyltransferase family 4 protein [Undibacterium flavidum]MBC3873611.1 glycosyltransferase family 4 protein [Undibacterium flavidum]
MQSPSSSILHMQGWRQYTQSLSLLFQNYAFELLAYPEFSVFHQELPQPPFKKLFNRTSAWETAEHILGSAKDQAIRSIPTCADPHAKPDYTLRIGAPFELQAATHGKTLVFAISEIDRLPEVYLGATKLAEIAHDHRIKLFTPSAFSRRALINSGAAAEQILTVPLGFDPDLFFPLNDEERTALRQKLRWDDHFVYLSVSSMYRHKGIDLSLKAFAQIATDNPHALLVFKGNESIYSSQQSLQKAIACLTPAEWERIRHQIRYIGATTSMHQIAQFYQAADVLISPYRAEGFNLPVLEAAACGLAILCTEGGPTDETTHRDFAWRIPSVTKEITSEIWQGNSLQPVFPAYVELMHKVLHDTHFRSQAKQAGPAYVRQSYTWQKVTQQLVEGIRAL